VLGNTHHNLTLGGELRHLDLMMNSVKERAIDIDSTLGPLVAAETTRMKKGMEKVERKMLKAEKRLHKEKLGQIEAVKGCTLPEGWPTGAYRQLPQLRTKRSRLRSEDDRHTRSVRLTI